MELNSFKELLLKKAEGNPTLQTLIRFAKDEIIAERVLESLEKMARPHASMGRGANAGVVAFANQLKNKDVEMMRDSLGHHIAHHKAALKAGNRDVADQHLGKIIPLMHLAGRSSAHSGGQLGLDYTPLEPWESNYTSLDRHTGTTGKLKEGTKGLGRRPKSSHPEGGHTKRTSEHRNVPDYRYLEMAPHAGHPDLKNSKHKGGYPFEEVQMGNPAKIDSGEAYLHIPEVEAKEEFTPHAFDHHPIHSVSDLKQDSLTPDKVEAFAKQMQDWHEHPEHKKWNDTIKSHYAADPEAYKMRGKNKAAHHFQDMELLEQPGHAKAAPVPSEAVSEESAAPKIDPAIYAGLPDNLKARFGGGNK
jgi:hypothetical protein